jgi:hypothetical protein
MDWLRKRGEALFDSFVFWGVAAVLVAVAGSVWAFGTESARLYVWEIVLVGVLFAVVFVWLFVLFRRLRRLENRPDAPTIAAPEPPAPPRAHEQLLRQIESFRHELAEVNQGLASWDFATIYHELRQQAIHAVPTSDGLMNLPEVPSTVGGMSRASVPDLRVYLGRMATLLEQSEAPRRTTARLR